MDIMDELKERMVPGKGKLCGPSPLSSNMRQIPSTIPFLIMWTTLIKSRTQRHLNNMQNVTHHPHRRSKCESNIFHFTDITSAAALLWLICISKCQGGGGGEGPVDGEWTLGKDELDNCRPSTPFSGSLSPKTTKGK